MKRSLLLFLVSGLLLIAAQAQAAGKLVNGIDANFPPFAFIDKTGQPSGFDVEVMDWIAKDLGMEVTHQAIEWDGIITSLLTKKIDIIASGMSINEDRLKQVNFTIPYWVIKQVFVTRKGSPLTVEDMLTGKKKLGVQQGTTEAKWLKEHIAEKGYNVTLRYYNSAPLAVEDLLNGRIDVAMMDELPADDAISKGRAVKKAGTHGEPDKFGVAMRKGDKDLHKLINDGYKKLMADPYWQELQKKYLNK